MATPIPPNRAVFTLEAIAEATAGTVRRRGRAAAVTGVVIDSRAVSEGCLFVALRGERHDAHRFLAGAVEAGAAALLVDDRAHVPGDLDAAIIAVDDTTRALGELSRAHRSAWEGTLVAVTGSAGKTTTKELTAAALAAAGARVHRTRGNLNNLVGVPMTLFELEGAHDIAVVEAGTSRPGEIARLAEIARPDVGVVTLVAVAHTEGLGSLEEVAAEKWALVAGLGGEGAAVLNADDASLRRLTSKGGSTGGSRAPRPSEIWFGRDGTASVRLVSHAVTDELRTHARYAIAGRETELEPELALIGEAAAMNAAAALAVCVALGRDVEKAAEGLVTVTPTPGRMRPLEALNGALVLDDAYNANPRSMSLALDTAAEVARRRGGHVIAVLGDMKELGACSVDEHASIGSHAARARVRVLAACGHEMRHAASSARRVSASMEVHSFDDPLDAVSRVLDESGRRDVILVKGSRSMRMERVVGALSGEADLAKGEAP